MNTSRLAIAGLALASGTTALAGISFAPVFGGLGPELLAAVFTPPAAVLGWALWVRRTGRLVAARDGRPRVPALMTLIALAVVAIAVGAATRPGADVVSGPYRLVTGALPADPDGPRLAAVSTLTGFAALVCCHLVLTRRSVLVTTLPAVSCLVAGLGLGAPIAPLPSWYAPAFVALTGVRLLVERLAVGRTAAAIGGGRFVTAAIVLTVAVVTPVAFGGVLPTGDREPADLQALVNGPVRPKQNTNPFTQFLALRNEQLVLTMSVEAAEPVTRLRMVTLTEFDGLTWSTRADYKRAGHRLPPDRTETARARPVTLDVRVDTPDTLAWLPTAGRASELSVAGLGVDETTGDIVVPAGSATPARYRVTGNTPVIAGAELARRTPAPASTRHDLDLPPDVLDFIATATRSASTDTERLLALYDTVTAAPFGYDGSADAPGGHSLFRIDALIREKRGTSEQYASAFAVMCRHLGWDARVVLGFRPRPNEGRFEVTGRDVHAWTEVRFDRLGWVPIDPTPDQASPGREPEDAPPPPPAASDPLDEVPTPGRQPPAAPSGAEDSASAARPPSGSTSTGLAWVAVSSGVILVLLLAIPTGKAVRRTRRRRSGSTRERGLAAWHEAIDVLRESGVRLPRHATTKEIVAAAGPSCPPAMLSLARRTDVTAFAPEAATDEDVRAAWTDSDHVRNAVRRGMSPPARIRATFNPRPLWTS